VRKAASGEFGLFGAAQQAQAAIASGSIAKPEAGKLYAAEHALIANLKSVAAAIYGLAAKVYQKTLAGEQELLLVLADITIQLFALESVVLRAEKRHSAVSEARRANLDAVVKVCAFDANEKFASATRRALSFIEDESGAKLRKAIQPFCQYDVEGLLQAKRVLAGSASESERYLF
jgi:hypothetical protein